MPHTPNLLNKMLTRGDIISVTDGRLCITPASKKDIPNDWMKENQLTLIQQCADQLGINTYLYEGYTTGKYGKGKHEGVTLIFTQLSSDTSAFVCFNANLKRQRNTKGINKGKSLPDGQFSVSAKGAFYSFWLTSGLKPPASTTRFYDRMGRLKNIVFTADIQKNERLEKKTIRPINITHEQILSAHNLRIRNA